MAGGADQGRGGGDGPPLHPSTAKNDKRHKKTSMRPAASLSTGSSAHGKNPLKSIFPERAGGRWLSFGLLGTENGRKKKPPPSGGGFDHVLHS